MSAAEPTPAVAAAVEVGGGRLSPRRAGDGPPVVVLHGGPGAHHDYLLPQYDLLARGRTLLHDAPRGGGPSPVGRAPPGGWREPVAALEALRRHWSIDRLTLLGYSWGGLLAVLYWLEPPERVERLALVSPAPARAAWRAEFERRFAARMADPKIGRARADLAASGLSRTDPEKYRRLAFVLSVAPYFRDPNLAKQMTPFRVTARTQDAVWASLGDYDLRPRLAETAAPAPVPRSLVVHGSYAPMPLDGARELAALLRPGVLEPATGPPPHVEATQDFVRALDRFLPRA